MDYAVRARHMHDATLLHVLGVDTDSCAGFFGSASWIWKIALLSSHCCGLVPACLLHSVGPEVEPVALAEFDDSVMATFGCIVDCDFPVKARSQFEFPTCQGGIGFLSASRLALVFVPARIEFRPSAVFLLEGFAEAFGDVSKFC